MQGKKGYPKFKRRGNSVEYKTSGWALAEDRKHLTLTDGHNIGRMKLVGTYDLQYYQVEQIKRVRLVRHADGYYAQFLIKAERNVDTTPTGKTIGLDVGLNHFYTDSNGGQVENPRFLRKSEKSIKRLHQRVSRKFSKTRKQEKIKQSNNYLKAKNKLSRKHLKVSRQHKDHAVKLARCVVASNDVVVYEDLRVANMVKNHKLAKSISDASWYQFRVWIEYFGRLFGRTTIAVAPQYTSQDCSNCGKPEDSIVGQPNCVAEHNPVRIYHSSASQAFVSASRSILNRSKLQFAGTRAQVFRCHNRQCGAVS